MGSGVLTKLGDKLGVRAGGYFIAIVTSILTVRFHYFEINENDFLKFWAHLPIMTTLKLHFLLSITSSCKSA